MNYLLDTNVWVQFLRDASSPVVSRLRSIRRADVRVCSVVAAELYYGCLRSANPAANRRKVEATLKSFKSLPFDNLAAQHYAEVRYELERLGVPIGPYDLEIAAIALTHDCILVTHNTREFSRVVGLSLEDWEQD